jgi:hypothetical protein
MTETRPTGGAVPDVDEVLVESPHEPDFREAFRALIGSDGRDIRERTTRTPERSTAAELAADGTTGRPVAVGSAEAPPDLPAAADRVVEGPDGVLDLLRRPAA